MEIHWGYPECYCVHSTAVLRLQFREAGLGRLASTNCTTRLARVSLLPQQLLDLISRPSYLDPNIYE